MNTIKSVYIVIVTFNGLKWLQKCLSSTLGFSVVVVDNCSTDNTVEFIKINFPEIEVIEQAVNLGFGKGNNIGINYAINQDAEHVFLLNQDAYLQKNCIVGLIAASHANPEYGVLSPIHLDGSANNIDLKFSNYVNAPANSKFISDSYFKRSKGIYEVPFVNAAAWLITKECLHTVGGFDPMFNHYGEDDNFCQRVYYHGLKVGILGTVTVIHDRPQNLMINQDYAILRERAIKLNWGNLNKNDYPENFNKLVKDQRRSIMKFNIKCQFQSSRKAWKELKFLERIGREVEQSRELNIKKSSTYLDFV